MKSRFVDTEKALLRRAKRWDRQALAEIYDLFSPRLYRYGLRLLGDADVAEECVAETFERFLLALHRGGGPQEYLQAYLFRVAHNWVTDYYRRHLFADAELDPNLRADRQVDEVVLGELETQELRTALAGLNADQRQAIVLKYLEGWQNEEISKSIARSVGAVKALQHRGLLNLQKALIKEGRALE